MKRLHPPHTTPKVYGSRRAHLPLLLRLANTAAGAAVGIRFLALKKLQHWGQQQFKEVEEGSQLYSTQHHRHTHTCVCVRVHANQLARTWPTSCDVDISLGVYLASLRGLDWCGTRFTFSLGEGKARERGKQDDVERRWIGV